MKNYDCVGSKGAVSTCKVRQCIHTIQIHKEEFNPSEHFMPISEVLNSSGLFFNSLQGDEAHLLALLHKARKLFLLLCSLSLLCRYCQVSVWLPRPLWLWLMASQPLKGRMDKADSSAVSVSVQRLGGC